MPLVDEAARALAQAQGVSDWSNLPPEIKTKIRRQVRAVLDAVREPNEAMAEAGAEIIRNVGPLESPAAHANDAVNTWRFMIDALRREIEERPL